MQLHKKSDGQSSGEPSGLNTGLLSIAVVLTEPLAGATGEVALDGKLRLCVLVAPPPSAPSPGCPRLLRFTLHGMGTSEPDQQDFGGRPPHRAG